MTPNELTLFYKYFNESIAHLETKIDDISERTDLILDQTTKTNGKVQDLEKWRYSSEGLWNGVNKALFVLGGISTFVLGLIWEWYKGVK